MRRHAKATSSRTNPRKPGGYEGTSSGRLRFAILAATVAAFLLVPAGAQAAAGVETLKVDAEGSGSGKVISVSEGAYKGVPPIDCTYAGGGLGTATGTCETQLSDEGENFEQVYLGPVPAPGSEFVKWTVENYVFEGCEEFEGCSPYVEPSGSGEDNGVAIAMFCLEGQSEEECLAPPCEAPCFPLTIQKEGEGTVVSTSGPGIECGPECEAEFKEGSSVKLTASPAAGYIFGAWSGCTSHVGLECTVVMPNKPKTVTAKFYAAPSLTIEKAGSGSGKASSKGISCDASCSIAESQVKTGTLVEVKTSSSKGTAAATFEGGTGNASGCTGGTCVFTITEDSSVKVKFAAISTKTVTLNLTGPAAYKGKVKGKAFVKGLLLSGLNCASGCTTTTETFFSTDEIELSAAAATGYTFKGWSVSGGSAGDCEGTKSPCKLKTDANKTVSAEFG